MFLWGRIYKELTLLSVLSISDRSRFSFSLSRGENTKDGMKMNATLIFLGNGIKLLESKVNDRTAWGKPERRA